MLVYTVTPTVYNFMNYTKESITYREFQAWSSQIDLEKCIVSSLWKF